MQLSKVIEQLMLMEISALEQASLPHVRKDNECCDWHRGEARGLKQARHVLVRLRGKGRTRIV